MEAEEERTPRQGSGCLPFGVGFAIALAIGAVAVYLVAMALLKILAGFLGGGMAP